MPIKHKVTFFFLMIYICKYPFKNGYMYIYEYTFTTLFKYIILNIRIFKNYQKKKYMIYMLT